MAIGGEKKTRTIADMRAERLLDGEQAAPVIDRLARDVVRMKGSMSRYEAKMVVRKYMHMQKVRIGMRLTELAMKKRDEPSDILMYIGDQLQLIERELSRLLGPFAERQPGGKWLLEQKGIGPVIAAGLVSELDVTKATSAGKFQKYAGFAPGQQMAKGVVRNWNAHLKRVCFYAGESFAKQANREDAYYGQVYKWRKFYEWEGNLAGKYSDQAANALATKTWDKSTEAYQWYSGRYATADFRGVFIKGVEKDGTNLQMLPPAHIYARAKGYAIRLLLSHLHQVMYEQVYGVMPPLPYPIQHLGHTDFYPPAGWTVNGRPVSVAPWQAEYIKAIKDNQVPDAEIGEVDEAGME